MEPDEDESTEEKSEEEQLREVKEALQRLINELDEFPPDTPLW